MTLFRALQLLLLELALSTVLNARPPGWLLDAARIPTPGIAANAPAVVLRDETNVVVHGDGIAETTHRYAVRILNQSGRKFAHGEVGYVDREDEEVRSTGAWIVRFGREVESCDKIQWIDMSAAGDGAIYTEERARVIDYSGFALEGDVFGYETVVEEKLGFPQLEQRWQARLPVVSSSLVLHLPSKWTSDVVVDGSQASALQVASSPQEQSWTLRDRPYYPEEPAESDAGRMDARLMITLVPPADLPRGMLPVFRTWEEMSDWLYPLQTAQCDSSAALESTARRLTSGYTDLTARIAALGRYVQELRYVSFDKGLGKGFGYRPTKASKVFANGWGDCKAKANLLRAMLRDVGIESFLVSADTKVGRDITDAWPSPYQFDHAIIAIKVDPTVNSPAVVDVPKFGRLLFFDPTNPCVLPGDLPIYLQGTKVFVVAPGNAALAALPLLPAESSHLWNRRAELSVTNDGSISGKMSVAGLGSAGAYERTGYKVLSSLDYSKAVARRLNATVGGAKVENLTVNDDTNTGEFSSTLRFTASGFGQPLPGGLMVVRLDVFGRDSVPAFPDKDRKLPIAMTVALQRDEVTLKLPSGFVVDELPNPVELSSPYGHYESTYAVSDGRVVAHRTLKIEDRTVPVSDYAALRKFLNAVTKADHAAVVLRQGG